jgi:hypothetical protein
MRSVERYYERRTNAIGRLVMGLHQRYGLPRLVPVLWAIWALLGALQVLLVALG